MKPRQPAGRFLTRNGFSSKPLRECPIVADEPELVDRIRDARTIRDEPECISDAILGDWAEVRALHMSQQHALHVAMMREVRPMLELEDRVRDIQRRARQSGFDLKRETALMRRDIERAKAGNRKPPARVLTRCEGLEALLDGVTARDAA